MIFDGSSVMKANANEFINTIKVILVVSIYIYELVDPLGPLDSR